jgi:fucose permease
MKLSLNLSTEMAGFISLAVSICTVLSSVFSARFIARWGAGKVTVFSVALTVIALFGFSLSYDLSFLILFAMLQGFGAGAIDAALSNYVALHYKARHMSWLHCFWGVGAMASPVIMAAFLTSANWRGGYQAVGWIQAVFLLILICALPLWRRVSAKAQEGGEQPQKESLSLRDALSIRGVKPFILAMLFYNGAETATGLWISTFLVSVRGLPVETAATYASGYFFGIMAGRVLSGFLSERVPVKALIRCGAMVSLMGLVMLLLPIGAILPVVGLFAFGLGGAPVYPSIVHDTPKHFGKSISQSIVGMELAGAYIGTTVIPLITGFIAGNFGHHCIPITLMAFFFLMCLSFEWGNQAIRRRDVPVSS